jgi:hypothetical protein
MMMFQFNTDEMSDLLVPHAVNEKWYVLHSEEWGVFLGLVRTPNGVQGMWSRHGEVASPAALCGPLSWIHFIQQALTEAIGVHDQPKVLHIPYSTDWSRGGPRTLTHTPTICRAT